MQARRSKELLSLVMEGEQLAAFFASHETQDARSSNYIEMCSGLTTEEATQTCVRCSGTGMQLLSKKRLGEYKRRIACADKPHEIREHLNEEARCPDCEGSGLVYYKRRFIDPDSMFNTVACPLCKGVIARDKPCRFLGCLGGYVIPVTVREKGSTKKGRLPRGATAFGGAEDFGASGLALGYVSKGHEVADLLRTSEAVARVQAVDAAAGEALAQYHGIEGTRWAATKWGRLFAVWPMTPGGRRLAQEAAEVSKQGSGFLLTPIERLASVRNDEASTTVPNVRWRALMRAADSEAHALYARGQALLTGVP